jgi:hypothetical protein
MDRLLIGNGGCGLLSGNGTKSHQEFVVYCLGIVKEGTNNFLNVSFAGIIQEFQSIIVRSKLRFWHHRRWAGKRMVRVVVLRDGGA